MNELSKQTVITRQLLALWSPIFREIFQPIVLYVIDEPVIS